ncbi:hypothetical protein SteCoe_3577 [Stentor coeruleus]|uniref:Uncharacterized protein n=1 Tax=Stentor coeruleus TaxID=5963 RepID=A0A1R2CWS1_9CILI|nr:hypothetical protein SteCoe_3577 [Stentor coeruleus]
MKNKDISSNPLRINYTLTLKSTKSAKSTKSTKSKQDCKEKEIIDSNSEPNTRRYSVSPKKSRTQLVISEITKLEEQLDSQEISLKIYEARKLHDNTRQNAEADIYEKYLDSVLLYISQTDNRLSKSLNRGWNGFKNSIKNIKNSKETNKKPVLVVETQDCAIQVNESQEYPPEDDIDIEKYINSLHNVMKRMNRMHLGKIMNKLHELSRNLRTVDIPSPSSTPEVEQLDFTDTIKSIHTKLKAHYKSKKPKLSKNNTQLSSKHTQTYMKLEDFKTIEHLKVIIIEKENHIAEISNKLRVKNDVEKILDIKVQECEELNKIILDMKTEACKQCDQKKNRIDETEAEIKKMKNMVNKTKDIEKELEGLKVKLQDSMSVINSKNFRIGVLNKEIEELMGRIEEVNREKCELEEKLEDEEKIKEMMEKIIKRNTEQNLEIKQYTGTSNVGVDKRKMGYGKKNNVGKTALKTIKILEKSLERSYREKNSSVSPFSKGDKGFGRFGSLTPSENLHETSGIFPSPDGKKNGLIRDKLLHKGVGNSVLDIKKSFRQENVIMQALNITKEEYLALSKRARMELYEALYEHREKCGADCEHLKRAMLIRQKDRGLLFPTKKYNIS